MDGGGSDRDSIPLAFDPERRTWSDRLAAFLGAAIGAGCWVFTLGLALGAW